MGLWLRPYTERVVQFGIRGGRHGVITQPVGVVPRTALLILGAGILHRVGPSRAAVHVARHLAGHGVQTLRFDHAGIGDSDRGHERLRDTILQDVRDGSDILLRDVPSASAQLTVLGFCSGADTAIVCSGLDPRISAVALFDPLVPQTVGYFARSLRQRFSQATPRGILAQVLGGFRQEPEPILPPAPDYFGLVAASRREFSDIMQVLNNRRVRRLWLLTSGVLTYCNDPRQVAEAIGKAASKPLDQVAWNPVADHVLSTRGQVDWLCHTVALWMSKEETSSGGRSTPPGMFASPPSR